MALAITEHLGEQPKRIDVIADQGDYTICRVALPSGPAIFKSNRGGSIGVESWAYRAAADLGVPVPRVLAVDLSRALLPADFFLVEEARGTPLSDLWSFPDEEPPAALRPLLAQAGGYAACLHAMCLSGFGMCDEEHYRSTGAIRGWDGSWRTALLAEAQSPLATLARAGLVDERLMAALQQVLQSFEPALAQFGDTRLLHGDLQVYHILVDPAEASVRAFIDFGDVGAGDPVWDLAIFSAWEDGALRYLLEGYQPNADIVRRLADYGDLYRLVRMVGIVAWFHSRGDQLRARRALGRVRALLAAIAE